MRRLSCLLCFAVLFASAACGSPQEEGSGGAEDSGPINIAFIGDFTGPLAPFSTASNEGLQLAVDEINDAGGADGRELTVEVFDDKNDPIQTVNIAKRIADTADLVVIGSGSAGVLSAGPFLEDNGVPYFVTVSSNPAVTESDWQWVNRVHLSDADQIDALIAHAVEDLGLENIGVLHDTSDFGAGGADLVKAELEERGMTVAAGESYNVGANDFSTQINALRGADLDAIVFWGLLDAGARVAEQLDSLGVDAQLIGGGGLVSDKFIELAGPAAEGTVASWAYIDPENAVAAALSESYEARTDRQLDVFAAQSYDAGRIVAQAIEEAGTVEPEALQQAIRGIEYEGAIGELTFDGQGQNVRQIFIGKVENGEWTLAESAE